MRSQLGLSVCLCENLYLSLLLLLLLLLLFDFDFDGGVARGAKLHQWRAKGKRQQRPLPPIDIICPQFAANAAAAPPTARSPLATVSPQLSCVFVCSPETRSNYWALNLH